MTVKEGDDLRHRQAEMVGRMQEAADAAQSSMRDHRLEQRADATDLELELQELAEEVIRLLLSKREDYGTANINLTGQHGVAVRLVDKTARLLNLTKEGHGPNHETLEDTWMDVVGYGLIGLTLEQKGEW